MSQTQASDPRVLLFTWWWVALPAIEMSSNTSRLSLSAFRLISLKVLNSIVLLGKSCQYVKEAKMEEKLFDPPPSSTPSKPSSKPQSKCKPSQGRRGLLIASLHHLPESYCLLSPWNKSLPSNVQQCFQGWLHFISCYCWCFCLDLITDAPTQCSECLRSVDH